MDGLTLEEAVAEGRLFWQNYYTVLADQVAPKVGSFAFLCNKDTAPLPLSIGAPAKPRRLLMHLVTALTEPSRDKQRS